MKKVKLVVAASGTALAALREWSAGDRFASNWGETQHPGEWYLATVTGMSGKKVKIKYDSDGSEFDYTVKYMDSQHIINVGKTAPKKKTSLTWTEAVNLAKKNKAPTVESKPAKTPATKPAKDDAGLVSTFKDNYGVDLKITSSRMDNGSPRIHLTQNSASKVLSKAKSLGAKVTGGRGSPDGGPNFAWSQYDWNDPDQGPMSMFYDHRPSFKSMLYRNGAASSAKPNTDAPAAMKSFVSEKADINKLVKTLTDLGVPESEAKDVHTKVTAYRSASRYAAFDAYKEAETAVKSTLKSLGITDALTTLKIIEKQ